MIRSFPPPRNTAFLLAFVLLLALVVIAEITQARQTQISARIARSQQREALISGVLHDLTAAEAAQRAARSTGNTTQLQAYQASRARIEPQMTQLLGLYRQDEGVPVIHEQAATIQQLAGLTTSQLTELPPSLTLNASAGPQQATDLMRSDVGNLRMSQIEDDAATLLNTERGLVAAELARGGRLRVVSSTLMAIVALLNVLLLIVAASYLSRRQSGGGAGLTEQLTSENELEQRVRRRTTELSTLSSHLQQMSEQEKANLARELHDELGGLLIAVKMDVSWLHKRWPNPPPDIQSRWVRVMKVLDDGVDFKRRVVENLRPTLLDNMGLLPAVRWIVQEICTRAGLQYTEIYPEHEPQLAEGAAIMVFRLVQESLTNVAKHAHATHVRVQIEVEDEELTVLIEDNGIGMDSERRESLGSHGLAIMRHRVRSCGGILEIGTGAQGGARLWARLPLAGILKSSQLSGKSDEPPAALAPRTARSI